MLAAVLLALAALLIPGHAMLQGILQSSANTVRVFSIDGAIGPASSDYIQRGLREAQEDGVYMAVIAMDTPGGLDLSMRDIIQAILDSSIPVVTYVHPQGARAASAGTYILYASHVAAMAPATSLGAATPVQIGMPSSPADTPSPMPIGAPAETGDENEADSSEEGEAAEAGAEAEGAGQSETEESALTGSTAMERKMINDATSYIRGLAELRGRNAEWAEAAVTEAATLSASEALEQNVIDFVADDLGDLLEQMHGLVLEIKGETITLDTQAKIIETDDPDWRTEFLKVITNPNLILILGMIGVYGLIIEFYNPGFGFAGVTGAICLLLAAYGLQLLPINYAGLALIFLGIILVVAEAMMPSFGILGIGGIIAFTIGSIILVDTDVSMFQVSLPLIAAVASVAALLLIIMMRIFMKIRRQGSVSGVETLVGLTGEAVAAFDGAGMVKVDGELWKAVTDTPLTEGETVKVQRVKGLQLEVTKAE